VLSGAAASTCDLVLLHFGCRATLIYRFRNEVSGAAADFYRLFVQHATQIYRKTGMTRVLFLPVRASALSSRQNTGKIWEMSDVFSHWTLDSRPISADKGISCDL